MEFDVVFVNYDGTLLYKTKVSEGGTAVYEGNIPKKNGEEFVGWDKPLKNITHNTLITAVFEKTKKGALKVAAISFAEQEKNIEIIDQAIVTNQDLHLEQENEVEK